MPFDKTHIIGLIQSYPFIKRVTDKGGTDYSWVIEILFSIEGGETLSFDMIVFWTKSPMQCAEESPVHFFNGDLIEYPHIMLDGHVCLHTPQCVTWDDRIKAEIEAVYQWIERYYEGKQVGDEHYEDIVIETSPVRGRGVQFYYTQLGRMPQAGDYGKVAYSQLAANMIDSKPIDTYIVNEIVWTNGEKSQCEWSSAYQSGQKSEGLFVMLNGCPAEHKKFACSTYDGLEGLCTDEQLRYLYRILYKDKRNMPIFWGYTTPKGKLRWLVTYPQERFLVENKQDGGKKHTRPKVLRAKMPNVDSADISYAQFFGRGRFPDALAEKNILLFGVGALGSGLATALVRGGVKHITLCDYDKKHPGNVCRSEYNFRSGLTKKAVELKSILEGISPFVEVEIEGKLEVLKQFSLSNKADAQLFLNEYDLIFDCAVDGELMWALEQLRLSTPIVSLSISNEAKDLVCAFSPHICEFVNYVSQHAIDANDGDMFNPEGCWSPTFKASYNDVQIVLQYALKYIVKMLSGEIEKKNFTIREKDSALHIVRW